MHNLKKFYEGKKVLITGHTGFSGSWLAMILKHLNADVYGISLKPTKQQRLYSKIKPINDKKSFIINISEYKKLSNTLNKIKPEIIFHLAAQPIVIDSYINPYSTLDSNVNGLINLLEISRNLKNLKTIIVVTSDKVYQNTETKKFFNEDDKLGGDDIYSASKAIKELLCASYFKSFFSQRKISIATARSGNIIGGYDYGKYRLIPEIIDSIKKNKKINIRNPKSVRPWQHVLEPSLGYLVLGKNAYKNYKNFSGGWNFSPDKKNHLTVYQIVNIIKKLHNTNLKIKISKEQFKEKKFLYLSNNKTKNHLKFINKLNIKDSLRLSCEVYFGKSNNLKNIIDKQITEYFKLQKIF